MGKLADAIKNQLVPAVEGFVQRAFDAADARAAALEKRIAAVERRPTYRYRWRADESYRDGDIVVFENALWSCDGGTAPGNVPGAEGAKWSLMLRGARE